MLPEVVVTTLFPARGIPTPRRGPCCVGAVGNVLMMITANLASFGVVLDGVQTILYSTQH
ncbi:hypothetical protein EDB81DRAFT_802856, partial [Dactylonectria macrodidyma]